MNTKDKNAEPEIVSLYVQPAHGNTPRAVNYYAKVPVDLLDPLLNLMSSLGSLKDAETALTTMSHEVRKHYLTARSQLTLRDFISSAESVGRGESVAIRSLMALARFASHNPDGLTMTCGMPSCGQHISDRCGHITSTSADTKDLLVVDTASLVNLTTT